jgi:DNA-binding NtrC family response regulator
LVVTESEKIWQWLKQRIQAATLEPQWCSSAETVPSAETQRAALCVVLAPPIPGPHDWGNVVRKTRSENSAVNYILAMQEKNADHLIEALRLDMLDFLPLADMGDAQAAVVEDRLRKDRIRALAKKRAAEAVSELRIVVDDFMTHMSAGTKPPKTRRGTEHEEPFTCNVLLVEPTAQNQSESAIPALQGLENITVETVTSGKEALQKANKQRFDIFVLDHGLQDMKTLDLMRQLSEVAPDSETIFVVGFTAADDAVDALRWGAATFLIKPYPPEDLAARVEELRDRIEKRRRTRIDFQKFQERYMGVWGSYEEATSRAQEPLD